MFYEESYTPNAPPDSLQSAIKTCKRSLHTNESSGERIFEGEEAAFEWRILEAYTRAQDRILTSGLSALQPGGREHEVFYHEPTKRWIKATMPWAAGYTVELDAGALHLRPARPIEYLNRLKLQNILFGDDIRLEGILSASKHQRIITSQPDIDGESPEVEVMDRLLGEQFGFSRLNIPPMGAYNSHSYLKKRVGLFDAHPANFRMSGDVLVPIDVILVVFSREEVGQLQMLRL